MTRVLLALAAVAVALAACSEDGGSSVADESESQAEMAMAERAEVLDALGLADDQVEVFGPEMETCVDSLAFDRDRGTSTMSAVLRPTASTRNSREVSS